MDKQAFEPTGLVPRSIIRTVERFKQQLLPGTEAIAIQEFRISRYQVLVSLRCLITLICAPILVNLLVKTILLAPTIEHFWNAHQNEIFINSYQEDRALLEMQNFSEKVFFESLLAEEPLGNEIQFSLQNNTRLGVFEASKMVIGLGTQGEDSLDASWNQRSLSLLTMQKEQKDGNISRSGVPPALQIMKNLDTSSDHRFSKEDLHIVSLGQAELLQSHESTSIEKQFQQKATQLAIVYNKESLQAVINLFGDCVTFLTVFLLSIWMRPQIVILKSFLTESIYSLSDTSKSFLLILCTDLLVGFHSPRGWEIAIESLLRHFGLPENQDFIFLFVAAFPVFLDTIFKYWIFRYLNKISPSTVATYHNMIE